MTTWYNDDSLWALLGPIIFGEGFTKPAAEQVEQVLTLAGLPPHAPTTPPALTVLDLPCGVGRHTIEFAKRAYRVVAVDRTTAYLDQARERASAEGGGVSGRVEFVKSDMREFTRPGAFDLAVNLFTSFGYFDDPADDRRVLEAFHTSLKPRGKLILELVGKEIVARIFKPRDWREGPGGTFLLEERELSRDFAWIENRWTVMSPQPVGAGGAAAPGDRTTYARRELKFGHRLYAASELAGLVASVGFTAVRVHGSLAGAPYDHNAQRLVVVAEKP